MLNVMIGNDMKYHTKSLETKSEDCGGGAVAITGSSKFGILVVVAMMKNEVVTT